MEDDFTLNFPLSRLKVNSGYFSLTLIGTFGWDKPFVTPVGKARGGRGFELILPILVLFRHFGFFLQGYCESTKVGSRRMKGTKGIKPISLVWVPWRCWFKWILNEGSMRLFLLFTRSLDIVTYFGGLDWGETYRGWFKAILGFWRWIEVVNCFLWENGELRANCGQF